MNYSEAIINIGLKYPLEVFKDPFYIKSLISDEIGNDYEANKLKDTLFLLSDFVDLYQLFTTHNLICSRRILNQIYQSVKPSCTIDNYIDAINPISKLFLPNEFTTNRSTANKTRLATVVKVSKSKPRKFKQEQAIVLSANVLKPLTSLDSVVNINLKVIAESLTIQYHDKSSYAVLVNNRDISSSIINSNSLVNKNKLDLLICQPNEDVTLLLPKKTYRNFKITSKNTIIDIKSLACNKFTIENIKARTILNVNAKKLIVKTENGFLDLKGRYDEVDVEVIDSSIFFMVGPLSSLFMKMKVKTINGDIYGDFISGKPIPKICKILSLNRHLMGTTTIGKCLLNYNFTAINGKVKI